MRSTAHVLAHAHDEGWHEILDTVPHLYGGSAIVPCQMHRAQHASVKLLAAYVMNKASGLIESH